MYLMLMQQQVPPIVEKLFLLFAGGLIGIPLSSLLGAMILRVSIWLSNKFAEPIVEPVFGAAFKIMLVRLIMTIAVGALVGMVLNTTSRPDQSNALLTGLVGSVVVGQLASWIILKNALRSTMGRAALIMVIEILIAITTGAIAFGGFFVLYR